MKQPDKLTAYYFRAALQTDTLYLDGDHAALDCSRQLYAALAAKGGERR